MKKMLRILIFLVAVFGTSDIYAQLPEIPATLRTPAERASYLTIHFWDNIDLNDSANLQPEGLVEQHFSNFVSIFDHTDSASIATGFRNLIDKASQSGDESSVAIAELAEKYLYEIESPVHSDKYFLIYAEESKGFSSPKVSKERIKYLRKVAASNMPGEIGADFQFVNVNGQNESLRGVLKNVPLNIMVLYDPECDHCMHTISAIRYNWAVGNAISKGLAQVLLIYPEGDKEIWKANLPKDIPQGYIYGLATEWLDDDGNEFYFVRDTPTIYLLDDSGKVIRKDAKVNELISEINDYTTTH